MLGFPKRSLTCPKPTTRIMLIFFHKEELEITKTKKYELNESIELLLTSKSVGKWSRDHKTLPFLDKFIVRATTNGKQNIPEKSNHRMVAADKIKLIVCHSSSAWRQQLLMPHHMIPLESSQGVKVFYHSWLVLLATTLNSWESPHRTGVQVYAINFSVFFTLLG